MNAGNLVNVGTASGNLRQAYQTQAFPARWLGVRFRYLLSREIPGGYPYIRRFKAYLGRLVSRTAYGLCEAYTR